MWEYWIKYYNFLKPYYNEFIVDYSYFPCSGFVFYVRSTIDYRDFKSCISCSITSQTIGEEFGRY